MMEYRGYSAKIEVDDKRGVLHGRVINTRDVITFEGRSVDELRDSMRDSIEDYLEYCRELGRPPDKPFSGRFQVRISPDLHRRVHSTAKASGMSINSFVAKVLDRASSGAAAPTTLTVLEDDAAVTAEPKRSVSKRKKAGPKSAQKFSA